MDSKTRVLMALSHEKPDRVPFNFWMDRRLMSEYEREIGHHHWRVTHYGADVIESFHSLLFPEGPTLQQDGTAWSTGPLFESWKEAEGIKMPDPNEEKVYELIKADIKEFPDKAVFLNIVTPWSIIASIRTYENIYMDMYECPEGFKKLSRRIADVMKVVVERACQMGVTAVYIQEDLATSKGLAMSPQMIKEFCLEYAKDFVEIARSYGKPVVFHSDGMVFDLIEPLLEFGVCAVNPLQSNLIDPIEFKKRFGNKIAVYGALDNCFTIPEGTVDRVRSHVLDVFEILGKPDGSLIMSCHDIPLGTPRENVEIMVETIKQRCLY
jgi:uroporphyrinogen decarboxylase